MGDVMQGYLQKLPVSLNVRVNKANCVGQLDKRIRCVWGRGSGGKGILFMCIHCTLCSLMISPHTFSVL